MQTKLLQGLQVQLAKHLGQTLTASLLSVAEEGATLLIMEQSMHTMVMQDTKKMVQMVR